MNFLPVPGSAQCQMRIEPDVGLQRASELLSLSIRASSSLSVGHLTVILVPTLIGDGAVVCVIFGWLLM